MIVAVRSGSGVAILVAALIIGLSVETTLLLLIRSWRILFLTHILLLIALLIFITTRHLQIVGRRRALETTTKQQHGQVRRRTVDYFLFVLGSGGHTKEMLMMMDDGYCNFSGFHRRYLISGGDKMSDNHLEEYEAELKALCKEEGTEPGTYDKCVVTRARHVHQPLWSTPFSGLLSILDIFPVLLSAPMNEVGQKVRYPTHIFSNGPATAFFVGLAAHILKIFYLVPEDVMRVVYIESWARISTLSLTGKLFHFTNITDVFMVQHAEVAKKYGIQNAGEMVFNSRRSDR